MHTRTPFLTIPGSNYVNIQVDWSGGPLKRLWGVIRNWSKTYTRESCLPEDILNAASLLEESIDHWRSWGSARSLQEVAENGEDSVERAVFCVVFWMWGKKIADEEISFYTFLRDTCEKPLHDTTYCLVQWNWFSDVTDACTSGASSDQRTNFTAPGCSINLILLKPHLQHGAVKLVLWRQWMHVTQVHRMTSENQFYCTTLYSWKTVAKQFLTERWVQTNHKAIDRFQVVGGNGLFYCPPLPTSNWLCMCCHSRQPYLKGVHRTILSFVSQWGKLKDKIS